MKIRILTILALGASVGLGVAAHAATDVASTADQAKLKATIENCAVCHGGNGHSVSPTFPNLAAQQPTYLENQLKAFKNETRADPDAQAFMWGMASQLDDQMIGELAQYFSTQPPPPSEPGDPKLIAEGHKIFHEGIPAQGVPACASCHGADAAGRGMFPRLAGQHKPYLIKQLLVIQSVLRTAPVMHGVIKTLSRHEMEAVATYLASL
ncbi:MAG: c-type cytochrome [Gammaproteobacteria bacterium]|nr:c-type cytochrome [Gammaproteobacteria bacterium]MDE2304452.1 c-type cytochrome [Gammaproteobacteria bacterium]